MTTTPLSPDTILFRYMDFAKFVALLQSKKLRFTRLSEFRDKQEGRFYNREIERRYFSKAFLDSFGLEYSGIGGLTDYGYEQLRASAETTYTSSFASCWTIDDEPSDLMWLAYAPNLGVAIQTTIRQLTESLPGIDVHEWDLHHGPCSYQPQDYNPLYQKRPRFKGEREYRVCYSKGFKTDEKGCTLPINLEKLLTKVCISPLGGSDWLVDVVRKELVLHDLPDVPVGLDSLD